MKKKLNFFGSVFVCGIIFLFSSFEAVSQKIEGDPVVKLIAVKMAEAYKSPTGLIVPAKAPKQKGGEPIWVVYSDRDQNQTYLDRNCTKPFNKINFMQAFIVCQETDNEIRLVYYDPSNSPFEEKKKGEVGFKPTAEDYGWIKKKNMLLWSVAQVDDSTFYSMKAISVKKIDKVGGLKNLISKGILDLYNYPNSKAEDNKRDIRLFQYMFILKEDKENNMVLLSKSNRTTTSNANEDVMGWASTDKVHVWTNALCLRINFEQAAIDERNDKKIDVQFFSKADEARSYKDGNKPPKLPFVYNELGNNEKQNPYYYGFPIIGVVGKDNTIYKTGYVTNTVDKNGSNVFTANRQARYNELYEDLQKKKENINIVFVLDGANRNFFKTINAVINDNALIGSTQTRNKYKLGAVIFNDTKAGEEERCKVFNLGSNKEDFMDRLRAQVDKVPTVPINRDANGAPVYEALKKACNLFPNSKSTNIIIMTGTTTDMDKSMKPDALNQMITKQVNMYFYQLANKNGALYDQYIMDCRYFLKETAKAIDNKFLKEKIASKEYKECELFCPDESCVLKNSGVPGAFYSKDAGESFKPDEILRKTKKMLKDIEDNLNSIISMYDQKTINSGKAAVEIDEEQRKQFIIMLKEAGIKEEDIETMANQENFQLFIEGYTTLVNTKLSHDLLTRTLFMNRREFQKLQDSFDRLNQSNIASTQRENLVDTYKDIILKYKGGVDPKQLEGYDLNYFMTLVTSLPNTNNKLFNRSLADLKNIKKTPDEVIQKLKDNFYRINKRLKDLEKNEDYILEQDDETFYWVPETVFHIDE